MSEVFICAIALIGLAVIIALIEPKKRFNERQEKQRAEREAKIEAEALARKKAHEARMAHVLRSQQPTPREAVRQQDRRLHAVPTKPKKDEEKSRTGDDIDDFIQRQNVIAAMSFDDSFSHRSSPAQSDSGSSSSYDGGSDSGSCGSDY